MYAFCKERLSDISEQKDFAHQVGLPAPAISEYVTGKVLPATGKLEKILEFLKANDLLSKEFEIPPPRSNEEKTGLILARRISGMLSLGEFAVIVAVDNKTKARKIAGSAIDNDARIVHIFDPVD